MMMTDDYDDDDDDDDDDDVALLLLPQPQLLMLLLLLLLLQPCREGAKAASPSLKRLWSRHRSPGTTRRPGQTGKELIPLPAISC